MALGLTLLPLDRRFVCPALRECLGPLLGSPVQHALGIVLLHLDTFVPVDLLLPHQTIYVLLGHIVQAGAP